MKKTIQILLFVLLAGVFLYSAWRLGSYYLTAFQQEKTVGSLRGQLNRGGPLCRERGRHFGALRGFVR